MRYLRGVRGVFNRIDIKPRISPRDLQDLSPKLCTGRRISTHAVFTSTHKSGRVILTGTVRSWHEREDVARAAWAIPGVTLVGNEFVVVP